ncbi:glutamate-gated chloride channel-like isoform X1 [Varroa destructor]|uniref:Ig-like domain-containing protein n=1 Tax=Varroa destructor TaxID=109461 RepID=A0A7M7JDX7_VARDE|nr:glutamate-gated chloride channel-like isoform X1 [Varroa destructor]
MSRCVHMDRRYLFSNLSTRMENNPSHCSVRYWDSPASISEDKVVKVDDQEETSLISLTSPYRETKPTRNEKAHAIVTQLINPVRYDPRMQAQSGADCEHSTCDESPVHVKVNTFVRQMRFDQAQMLLDTQLIFRMEWNDPRLTYLDNSSHLPYVLLDKPSDIWVPDLFLSSEIRTDRHDFIIPNVLIRIYPNGDVLYSTRISSKLNCIVDLAHFPFDSPVCELTAASYAHTTDDLVFWWKEKEPIQIDRAIKQISNDIHLDKVTTRSCTSSTTTGEYTCIKAQFFFKRNLGIYVVKIYAPCLFLLLIAYSGFFVKHTVSSVRSLLHLLPTLLLAHYSFSFDREFANTMVHQWIIGCLVIALGSLIEFLILIYMHEVQRCEKLNSRGVGLMGSSFKEDARQTMRHYPVSNLDILARVVFFIAIGIFNLAYFL